MPASVWNKSCGIVGWWIVAVLSIAVGIFALRFLSNDTKVWEATSNPVQVRGVYIENKGIFFMHIVGSILALILSPFQLHEGMRKKYLNAHRNLGKFLMVCMYVGSVGAFGLSFKAFGGTPSTVGFSLLAATWIATAAKGYVSLVKDGDVREHREWMIRNFACTFAAVTLRIQLPIAIFSQRGALIDSAYSIISFTCWIPNLIVAEWYLKKSRVSEESQKTLKSDTDLSVKG